MSSINQRPELRQVEGWEPLPKIAFGFAIHPFHPSTVLSKTSTRSTNLNDTFYSNSCMADLEVGDEIYAFERYIPNQGVAQDMWYRGYIVSSSQVPVHILANQQQQQQNKAETSAVFPSPFAKEIPLPEPSVTLGIFPASFVHIREELEDAEKKLTSACSEHAKSIDRKRGKASMEALAEEEEEEIEGGRGREGENLRSSNGDLQKRTPKLAPPIPSLKAGDETAKGTTEPLVDEIACALREWHFRLFVYLLEQNYALFHTVRAHISALHIARRQLIDSNLDMEELDSLRRDCVARLVRGNVIQGLEVIVRHPSKGGLVVGSTDKLESKGNDTELVSGTRMFTMQVASAYITSATKSTALDIPMSSSRDKSSSAPLPSLNRKKSLSVVPSSIFSRNRLDSGPEPSLRWRTTTSDSRVAPSLLSSDSPPSVDYFHLFLELRAFVANLCIPGETAELFFSLYSDALKQFITEEFLVILDHQGNPVSNPLVPVRTLFQDLGVQDVEDIMLVCKIIRRGGMKMSIIPSTQSTIYDSNQTGITSALTADSDHRSSNLSHTSLLLNQHASSSTSALENNNSQPGANLYRASRGTSGVFRRPFGCAVVKLGHLVNTSEISETKSVELKMKIFKPAIEADFASIHEDIINGRMDMFERSSRTDDIAIDIRFFHGHLPRILRSNSSLLQDTPCTQRLGFPDVVFPDQNRNDFYVKLWSASFHQVPTGSGAGAGGGGSIRIRKGISSIGFGGSSVATHQAFQVDLEVRDRDGRIVDNAISQGSREHSVREYSSIVFNKSSAPTFGELVKISNVLPDSMRDCHLFFTFRQRLFSTSTSTTTSNSEKIDGMIEDQEKPFAFAFVPLLPEEDGSFLPDGDHVLILYRTTEELNHINPKLYLSLPFSSAAKTHLELNKVSSTLSRTVHPIRDSLSIRSFLCSTTFTQSEVLVRFLHWKKNDLMSNPSELTSVLKQLTFVSEVEICKVLSATLDTLFGIIVDASDDPEVEGLVFDALVRVLGIVQDRRFSNFQKVLDVYIDGHFSSANVWKKLISAMSRLLKLKTSQQLRAAIKVWRYIFRLISRSRELQKIQEASMMGGTSERLVEHLEMSFKDGLHLLLRDFTDLMKIDQPSIIGTQTIALQYFSDIIPDLSKTFNASELSDIIVKFSDSAARLSGKGAIWKLLLHLQTVKSVVFEDPTVRAALIPSLICWIKPHLGRFLATPSDAEISAAQDTARISWIECLRISINILAVMLDRLSESLATADQKALIQEQENVDLVFSCLPKILDSYHELRDVETLQAIDRHRPLATVLALVPIVFPSSYPFALVGYLPRRENDTSTVLQGFNILLGEISIVLLEMISLQTPKLLRIFLEDQLEFQGQERFDHTALSFFQIATSILAYDAFPDNWINIAILAHLSILKFTDQITTIMASLLPQDSNLAPSAIELWKAAFKTIFAIVGSKQLVIESFGPQKCRAVWRLGGDLREESSLVLHRMWQSLGHTNESGSITSWSGRHHAHFLTFVSDILSLCLSHHDSSRIRAVEILYTMFVSEWSANGSISKVESEMIDKLDIIFMQGGGGDDLTRAYFVSNLRAMFSSSRVDPQLRAQAIDFLDSVDRFLSLLLSLRDLPKGEEYEDDRTVCALRLLNFIRRIGGKDALYISYVHQLVDVHVRNGDFVEAGLTLKLHASLYEWNLSEFVEPFSYGSMEFPRQSHFRRKESILMQVIDYLGRGSFYELAASICQEVESQHSSVTFDYNRLAELLSHRAQLVESIVTKQRPSPQYFLVSYFGPFPIAVRDRQFIFRGGAWEKYGAFCDRLQNNHPSATLIKSIVRSTESSEQLRIQIVAVTPEPDRSLAVFNQNVPREIRSYHEFNNVSVFSYSRPFNKHGRVDEEINIAEVYLEKVYLTTEESFPTILRRSEVKECRRVEISPIQNALDDVHGKTKELTELEARYTTMIETMEETNTSPLSMALNGAVDAPINGGIPAWRAAFFSEVYAAQHPEEIEAIEELRTSIDLYTMVIERCLVLHGLLCPNSMSPFHITMEQFFRKNFAEEIKRLSLGRLSSSTFSSIPSSRPEQPGNSPSPISTIIKSKLFQARSSRDSHSPDLISSSVLQGSPGKTSVNLKTAILKAGRPPNSYQSSMNAPSISQSSLQGTSSFDAARIKSERTRTVSSSLFVANDSKRAGQDSPLITKGEKRFSKLGSMIRRRAVPPE
ncbi:Signaling protein DOCK180 [Phaffia rhodozyma]|uniref:Signaling protein DOCK180 n=1 Tax=Phaffia rhodozyma TaxID=264483 RepID=A0A0F7SH62_PHARH|nr:Signaling protein DOCK180 [Phaffia rhodozyma]